MSHTSLRSAFVVAGLALASAPSAGAGHVSYGGGHASGGGGRASGGGHAFVAGGGRGSSGGGHVSFGSGRASGGGAARSGGFGAFGRGLSAPRASAHFIAPRSVPARAGRIMARGARKAAVRAVVTRKADAQDMPLYLTTPGALIRTAGQLPVYTAAEPARTLSVEGGGFIALDERRAQNVGAAPGVRWGAPDRTPSGNALGGGGAGGGNGITANDPALAGGGGREGGDGRGGGGVQNGSGFDLAF